MPLPSEYVAKCWCQGADARDKAGGAVDTIDIRAACWCPSGAINAAYHAKYETVSRLEDALAAKVGEQWVAWNDAPERTQGEVVALLQAVEKELGLTQELKESAHDS